MYILRNFAISNTNMMKHRFTFLYIIMMMLSTMLAGCNDDVFVDKLSASATEVQMNSAGDSAVVTLSTKDWYIASIKKTKEQNSENYPVTIFDENGKMTGMESFLYIEGNAKLVFSNPYNGFTIERKDNTLKIKVERNRTSKDFLFTVFLANSYGYLPVSVTQLPSTDEASSGKDFTK